MDANYSRILLSKTSHNLSLSNWGISKSSIVSSINYYFIKSSKIKSLHRLGEELISNINICDIIKVNDIRDKCGLIINNDEI